MVASDLSCDRVRARGSRALSRHIRFPSHSTEFISSSRILQGVAIPLHPESVHTPVSRLQPLNVSDNLFEKFFVLTAMNGEGNVRFGLAENFRQITLITSESLEAGL